LNENLFLDGKISPENVLKKIKNINPAKDDLYNKLDDISLARLFSDVFKSVIRYNVTSKMFYFYDGKVWKPDIENMKIEKYAKIFARAIYIYSADQDTDFKRFANSLGNRKKRTTMIQDSRDFIPVKNEDFDTQENLFNCQNCIIDLYTGNTIPHDPSLLLSKVSNAIYDKDAHSFLFEKFINEVMCDDKEKISYLQKLIGYALTGNNILEQCFIIYGSTTRNGKSTFLDTIGYLFGDYAMNIQPETLAERKKNSANSSGDIARLDGCRFLHMSEPPKRMKFDVALLKTLIGRDKVTARHMYEREFEFIPVFKLFINTNFLPIVSDDTLFSSGRISVITFDRHFSIEEQNTNLKLELKAKNELSGILNWCLEGLRQFKEAECKAIPPQSVINAIDDYRSKSDKIKTFIDECLVKSNGNLTAKEVYRAFNIWCEVNGYYTENKGNFLEELRAKGILHKTGTINGTTVYNVLIGYSFIDNSEFSYSGNGNSNSEDDEDLPF